MAHQQFRLSARGRSGGEGIRGCGEEVEVARKCWLGSVVVDGMGVGVTWEGVPCTGWRRVGCGLYKGVEGMRVRGSADRQYMI